jgi:hypothetical protein
MMVREKGLLLLIAASGIIFLSAIIGTQLSRQFKSDGEVILLASMRPNHNRISSRSVKARHVQLSEVSTTATRTQIRTVRIDLTEKIVASSELSCIAVQCSEGHRYNSSSALHSAACSTTSTSRRCSAECSAEDSSTRSVL